MITCGAGRYSSISTANGRPCWTCSPRRSRTDVAIPCTAAFSWSRHPLPAKWLSTSRPFCTTSCRPRPGHRQRAAFRYRIAAPFEQFLYERALKPWAARSSESRVHEVERVEKHVDISLNALIDRQQVQLGEFLNRQIAGQTVAGLDGLIAQAEQHLDELNTRREVRQRELELERHCSIADITHIGRAEVLPHPERTSPQLAPMVRDEEIERIAVAEAIRHEEARGWVVESVEAENRGFDLISRRPHPEDPKTFIEVRFIEVKGRAGVGVIALSENEYRTAQR